MTRRLRALAACGALVLAMPGLARMQAPAGQAPPSIKGAELKGRAPVSAEVLRVTLPRPQEADLANGLHLMVLEDRRVPLVTFQVLVQGAGGYYDPADGPGLAEFTATMMREGTATRSSGQIAEQLDALAASVSVSAGMSSTAATLSGSCLAEHVDRVLDLAADVLLHPSFPEDELSRFKQRRRASLVQQRSSPAFLAGELFARVVYGAHPAARVSPTPAALEAVTRETLAAFHRTHYVPDHAVVAVAGDISMADARRKIEARLGAWKKTGAARPPVVDPPALEGAKVYLVDRPGSVQTNLAVGTLAIDRLSPDYFPVTVMNRIVGGGPTGRLFLNLREDKGYTYGAYSSFTAVRYRGAWEASTEVRTEVTREALAELLGEVRRIREEPVPDQEFLDARRAMVASFALSLESPSTVLNNHVTRWLYGLPADYWDRYPERVMAVTKEEVRAAARKYLDPARLQIVAVGDGATIADALETFGPVETYDTEGRKIESGR